MMTLTTTMPSLSPSLRLLLHLLGTVVVVVVSGQESPALNLQMFKTYDTDKTYRQNVCDRHDLYYEGVVELRDALSGRNVNVYVPVWDDFYFKLRNLDTDDGGGTISTTTDDEGNYVASTNVVIDETNPGLIAEVLDEIGRRGNFTWRNSYGYTPSPEKVVADPDSGGIAINKTWTDLLLWSTQNYDLSADEWFHTNERMKMGITFPEGFVDVSIVLADKVDDNDDESKGFSFLWSWTKPFNGSVWAMIVGTAIVSGLIYGILETSHDTLDEHFDHFIGSNPDNSPTAATDDGDRSNDKTTTISHLTTSLYGIVLIYFQHVILYPKTIPGKIMVCSIGFWSLIMVATYTANLASFFVIQNTPDVTINSIQDAIDHGMSMCLYEGISIQEWVNKYYPKGIYIPKPGPYGHFDALFDGVCDLAVVSVNAIQRASVLKDVNRNCQLQQIGRVIQFQQGGFALKADSGTKCTSLIQDVFHVHLSDMRYDGTLLKLTKKYLSNMQEMTCNDGDSTDGGGGSINDNRSLEEAILSLKEMSGAFMNHAIALLMAVLFGISSRKKRKNKETGGGGGDGYYGQDYTSRSNNNGVHNNINDIQRNGNSSKWNGTSSSSSSLSSTIRHFVKKNDILTKNGEKLSKRLEEISENDETISQLLSSIRDHQKRI